MAMVPSTVISPPHDIADTDHIPFHIKAAGIFDQDAFALLLAYHIQLQDTLGPYLLF